MNSRIFTPNALAILGAITWFAVATPISSAEENEAAFARLFSEKSQAAMQSILAKVPESKRNAFTHAFKRGAAVFLERFDIQHFLQRHARVLSIAYPIALVNDHIIVATLFAIGEPALAAAYWGAPGSMIQVTLGVAFADGIDNLRMLKEAGLLHRPWELWAMHKKSRSIIGASRSNHLLAAIIDECEAGASEVLSVNVVRKIRKEMELHAELYITRKELEAIVRKAPNGGAFLDASLPLYQRTQIYITTLLDFIHRDPKLSRELSEKLSAQQAAKTAAGALESVADRAARAALREAREHSQRLDELGAILLEEIKRHKVSLD